MTWKILRTKDELDDDPGLEALENGVFRNTEPPIEEFVSGTFVTGTIDRVAFAFLNTAGQYVVGDRGSLSFHYLEVFFERGGSGQIVPGSVVVFDSELQVCAIGYKPIIPPPDMSVVNGTIRVQDIVPPVGGTQVRIFVRMAP